MYADLKTLLESRRTPRFVDQGNIPETDIQKILDAIKLAPSFDKVYPYEVHVLTNSEEGISKKKALLEFYVCHSNETNAPSKPGDPWEEREICQPILSGLVLVYIASPVKSSTCKASNTELNLIAHRDIMVSATYAMLSAKSLGYATGMFSAVYHNESIKLFTKDTNAKISLSVTVANVEIPEPFVSKMKRRYIEYNNQRPFVYPKKHRDEKGFPKRERNLIFY